jgi:hypothetical protein
LHILHSSNDDNNNSNLQSTSHDYTTEETLMKIHLLVLPTVPLQDALDALSKYTQSFPFAAVLPVQPLTYLPVREDGGVQVSFLRKKTGEKQSIDGGIRFFIEASDNYIDLTAKRNSDGQYVNKLFAEKLVITAFVAGVTGRDGQKYGHVPPLDKVRVESLFHKWM